ncbi:MAG: hypothetical protein CMJ59_02840 [Planctomycetaceae bacterium]|nr:hypothetical protein [Planctomycetaceae bacterium]
MRYLFVLPFVALTFVSWGVYGPVLHEGQLGLGEGGAPSSLRPLICVGLAYFFVAVLVPVLTLKLRGEQGSWTSSGAFWSVLSGVAGAVGALGIIMAFKGGGKAVYVMPLVFGLAPVVNTLVTMAMTKSFKETNKFFIAAIAVVALGAAGVMFFSRGGEVKFAPLKVTDLTLVVFSILLTAFCWGVYGPVLHRGQMKMAGSRLRPFLCVGLAYFVIAVIVPTAILQIIEEPGSWRVGGTAWSLAGGAAGAIGALGIILAFNFGGKPIFVMPLVFGVAPVVNTFTTIVSSEATQLPTAFYVSLVMVAIGAVGVLVFAPKPKQGPKPT